jgi:hypothetical protein
MSKQSYQAPLGLSDTNVLDSILEMSQMGPNIEPAKHAHAHGSGASVSYDADSDV